MTKEKIEWKIESLDIAELIKYHKNPRKISKVDFNHLKTSIKKFGLVDKPVVTMSRDGYLLLGGHQRLEALKSLGYIKVDCWVSNRSLSDKEIEEANIRFNKNQGEWDFDILANEWEIDDLIDWGFTADEFQIDLTDDEEHKSESDQQDSLGSEIIFNLSMKNEIASSFENQLDALLMKFEGIKKVKK